MTLDFVKVADKWQEKWRNSKAFESDPNFSKEGYYMQTAYPYPSGAMHIGHGRTYTVPDAILRFKRMQGFNVLYPMGWHVTGTPVIAQCEKVASRDEKTIDIMTRVFKIPESDLELLTEPLSFVDYFVNKATTGYKAGMKKLGIGIDWRRELTTIDPHYSKFISWQYNVLKEKRLIIQGKFPVRYCPHDKNAVGDHDLSDGEGVDIVEYMVYKFECNGIFLPAATLRPETIFGVTNMWLNPEEEYVLVNVCGEEWVVSGEASEKLKHQYGDLEVVVKSVFDISSLFGKLCKNPITGNEVPLLPASFVKGGFATGVVMSVPAHAPLDFVALEDLKKDTVVLERFNINHGLVSEIKPIAIIKVDGYGEFPAIDVCKRLGIFSQKDSRCEEATSEVYKKEFHTGVLNQRTGKFKNTLVAKAKDVLSKEFKELGKISSFFELSSRPVTCRCGTEVVVKILDNQWFVKYSDKDWKQQVQEQIDSMQIIPKEYKSSFDYTVGWLENKPCARQKGLGTKMPWDPAWIIEPLGDSTIYMAYFTLSHLIKELDSEKLSDSVFDFVFLKKGDVNEISNKTSILSEKLIEMQKSFDYWYPLRFNCSANELVQNHMSYSIFHHTAIFKKEQRQNGELVLGMGLLEGRKMSSSKGNVILIDDIAVSMGADMVRFFLLNMGEPWQDFDWRQKTVEKSMRAVLLFFNEVYEMAFQVKNAKNISDVELKNSDLWLLSRINRTLQVVTDAYESFEVRKAIMSVFFDMSKDFKQYQLKSSSRKDIETIFAVKKYFVDAWVRAIAPITPHVCEEIWSILGNDFFVIDAKWPISDKDLINDAVEKSTELVETVVSDIKNICEITGNSSPKKVVVYTSPDWKWFVVKQAMELTTEKFDSGKIISEVMKNPEVRLHGKMIPKFVQSLAKSIYELKKTLVWVDELKVLSDESDYISKQIGCQIVVDSGENPSYDPIGKSKNAKPLKPAIYLE